MHKMTFARWLMLGAWMVVLAGASTGAFGASPPHRTQTSQVYVPGGELATINTDVPSGDWRAMTIERRYGSQRNGWRNMFGYRWSTFADTRLSVRCDGAVLFRFYDHNYLFASTTAQSPSPAPSTANCATDEIMATAKRMDRFGSDLEVRTYQEWLHSNGTDLEEYGTYRDLGLITRTLDLGASFTSTTFDGYVLLRVPEGFEIHPLGNPGTQLSFSFDSNGRFKRSWDATGQFLVFRYDSHGNLSELADQSRHRRHLQYNGDGYVSRITDETGHVLATYKYNEDGYLIAVDGAQRPIYRYGYDRNDNLISIRVEDVTPEQLTTIAYAGPNDGRVVRLGTPRDGTNTYQYARATPSPSGSPGAWYISQVTLAKSSGTTQISYTVDGFPTTVTPASGPKVDFGYEPIPATEDMRLASLSEPGAPLQFFYCDNKIVRIAQAGVGVAAITKIDADGNRTWSAAVGNNAAADKLTGELNSLETNLTGWGLDWVLKLPTNPNTNPARCNGITGLTVAADKSSGYVIVSSVFPGGPAEKAGIMADDLIVSIDGVSTKGMALEDASARIRGISGTSVMLSIERKGQKTPSSVALIRAPMSQ